MGSYFSKKPKPKETTFESLERKIDAMNPNSYPTFEKSLDWSKTKHVYSDSFCLHEKYVSYTILGVLLLFNLCFLFLSFRKKSKPEQNNHDDSDLLQDNNEDIQIGEDVQ